MPGTTNHRDSPISSTTMNPAYEGTVIISGTPIHWKKSPGGEIQFARNSEEFASLVILGLSEDEELKLSNHLLDQCRPTAIPDRNGYYAASVVITQDGKLFVDVNNESYIKHPFAGRGCAETYALRQIQKDAGTDDVQIARVYLKSGMATKNPDGSLTEREPGHVGSMCGECRQNFRAHSNNAQFIMVPTAADSDALCFNDDEKSIHDLHANQAWRISHETMYPLPKQKEIDSRYNNIVREGYLFATDSSKPALAIRSALPEVTAEDEANGQIALSIADYRRLREVYDFPDLSLPSLKENPSLENINRCMVQCIKRAYEAHAEKAGDGKNLDITVVMIKTSKGEFYPAISVNGDLWLPSKPPELPMALANAYNQIGISAVYMMSLNDQQIRNEMNAWNGGSGHGHQLKMPDPAGLGRLLKNIGENDNPALTVMPLNNGELTAQTLEEISPTINVRESFGPAFSNPKKTISLSCC